MYGPAVRDIVEHAKKTAPGSLAAKSSPSSPVFSYTAPKESGSGSINIYLEGRHADWPVGLPDMADFGGMPHALVAPNAGLLSYPAWGRVIVYCIMMDLPFAVTEYAEQSAETQRSAIPIMLKNTIDQIGSSLGPLEMANAMRTDREHPIELNPFARPGQSAISCSRLPSLVNGFTMKVSGD